MICFGRIVLLILIAALVTYAQTPVQLEFGVRLGVPFTVPLESRLTGPASVFSSQAFDRSAFSAGPTFAVVVYDRVAVEFDALYKPIEFRSSVFTGTSTSTSVIRGSSWEFPLIANYRFLNRPVRPYGGGGMLLGQTLNTGQFRTFLNQLPAFVLNGGLEWPMSRLVLRPELRYTRWSAASQSTAAARRENQFEYLIGFSFRRFRR